MPLELKSIGGDDFEGILEEIRARIPVHTPEWTHTTDSDPGITIAQLFAFMAESLLYRANRIPDRNRQKFLSLLRLPLDAASAAEGFVSFDGTKGPLDPTIVTAGQTLFAGKVPFRTTEDVTVLPLEWRILYKAPATLDEDTKKDYEAAYSSFLDGVDTQSMEFYQTTPFPTPEKGKPLPEFDVAAQTLDDGLWLALLAPETATVDAVREHIGGKTLSVGIVPVYDEEVVISQFPDAGTSRSPVVWEMSTDVVNESGATPFPRYQRLDANSEVDVFQAPGTVRVTLPASDQMAVWAYNEPTEEGAGDYPPRLEEEGLTDRLVAWIRMRFVDDPNVSLHWMGLNAAGVRQGVVVTNEFVGKGTGEPDQSQTLANTPVMAESLELQVENGEGGWEAWEEVHDLLGHGSDENVYTLDLEAGQIRFGDGIDGRRPGEGRRIRAGYEYGGGTQGNVEIDAIRKAPGLPGGVKVANPLPTWGGADGESTEDGEKRIPQHLRHRERAVTVEDFRDIVERTPGVRLGRQDVLPAFHPEFDDPVPGSVTLMVIPEDDPLNRAAPRPDSFFLRSICDWIEPRRLVTSEVHILGPCYRPVWVSVGVQVRGGYARDTVLKAVETALEYYLSPLTGGPDEDGWPLGKAVLAKDLEAQATRVSGVEFVEELLLCGADGVAAERIPMEHLDLPELVDVSVTEGEPTPLDEIRGDAPRPGADKLDNVLSVPVVPERC